MESLNSYKLWLEKKNYSGSTIKNYLVDINKYFNFVTDTSLVYLPETVSAYLDSISSDANKDRYASSLSKYFQFSIDQDLIASNPLIKAKKQSAKPETNLELLLDQYQGYLAKKKFSPATIKNYLNDIQQFITWSQTNPDGSK